jgi:hypothetical protein
VGERNEPVGPTVPQKEALDTLGVTDDDCPVRRSFSLALLALVFLALLPGSAQGRERISAVPGSVDFGETLTVRGSGWPVIEFCSRTVRLSLSSGQNAFAIGRVRVRDNGRFAFRYVPRRGAVGAGFWRVVARMRCESGKDGSPIIRHASDGVRIGRPRSYCSPSGDLCYGIRGSSNNPVLRIDSFVDFGRYQLCVTAPDGSRVCRLFRLREGDPDLFTSAVRWGRHYPARGGGIYRVRWKTGGEPLGPRLSFRRRSNARAGVAALSQFQSPSRNIGCAISRRFARCDIREKEWEAPRPRGCPRSSDFGQGLTVSRRSRRGRVVCAGDTTLGAGPVLNYGKRIKRGQMLCRSRRRGMTCRNGRRHGFFISRRSYRTF